jgi:hypothetical protein
LTGDQWLFFFLPVKGAFGEDTASEVKGTINKTGEGQGSRGKTREVRRLEEAQGRKITKKECSIMELTTFFEVIRINVEQHWFPLLYCSQCPISRT